MEPRTILLIVILLSSVVQWVMIGLLISWARDVDQCLSNLRRDVITNRNRS